MELDAMKALRVKRGWAVSVTGRDGQASLARGPMGDGAPVWERENRRLAVEFMRDLLAAGLTARVVSVVWAEAEAVRTGGRCLVLGGREAGALKTALRGNHA